MSAKVKVCDACVLETSDDGIEVLWPWIRRLECNGMRHGHVPDSKSKV